MIGVEKRFISLSIKMIQQKTKQLMKLKPEILQHPNIPKPLHGLAPRVILGQEWWDITRQEAYASTDYHCMSCGVHKTEAKYHQWLEAHEDYNIDYEQGIMKINKIIPLCHSCHNFIHSGRLIITAEPYKIIDILKHGLTILEDNNLKARYYTLDYAEDYFIKHNCKPIDEVISGVADWDKWKLILEGVEYFSKFKDYQDWLNYYNK